MADEAMDPLPVKGYTPQSQDKVDLVNKNKELEETTLRLIEAILKMPDSDARSASIAFTKIQEGFMWLNRSVFNPQRVDLNAQTETPVQEI